MSRRVAVRLAVTCLSPVPWSPCGQELAPWRLPSVEQEAGWGQQPCISLQGSQGDSKNAKKKNNKKTNKNKSSISRANKKKPSMPNVSNDLSQKLYATMEKHNEVRAGGVRGGAGAGHRAGSWPQPSSAPGTAAGGLGPSLHGADVAPPCNPRSSL